MSEEKVEQEVIHWWNKKISATECGFRASETFNVITDIAKVTCQDCLKFAALTHTSMQTVEQPKAGELPPLTWKLDAIGRRIAIDFEENYDAQSLAQQLSEREAQLLAEQQVSAERLKDHGVLLAKMWDWKERAEAAEASLAENARIIGKSGSVEAALRAELATLRAQETPKVPTRVNNHPPTHWEAVDGWARHPQNAEEWDWPVDPAGSNRSELRLNFASDRADPHAPDQMALILRLDLLRIMARMHSAEAYKKSSLSRNAELADLAWHVQICDGTMSRDDFIELVRVRLGGTKSLRNERCEMTIREQLEVSFDHTDANACSDVTNASVKILQYAARALWAEHHGMRMGRDDSRELGVAVNQLGRALRLLPYGWKGADSDAFYARLLKETGIVETSDDK